jgi:peptidoglycan hydrolase CwlO-like protein
MGRFLAGALLVLIIAAIAFFMWSKVNDARQEALEEQITAMNKQLSQISDENTRLKAELSKVQGEEQNLAAQNDELRKAIASVKATGKLPTNIELELNPPK